MRGAACGGPGEVLQRHGRSPVFAAVSQLVRRNIVPMEHAAARSGPPPRGEDALARLDAGAEIDRVRLTPQRR